jgi:hypothetical protein
MKSNLYQNRGITMAKYTVDEINRLLGERGYTLVGDYVNNKTPLKVICPIGHPTDTITLTNFRKGSGCQVCAGNIKHSLNDVAAHLESNGYTLISTEYSSGKDKVQVECPKGHRYPVRFFDFQRGSRCPVCKESRGEKLVAFILKKILPLEATVIPQKLEIINDKRRLYDFYFELNEQKYYIEYDGEFHYKERTFNGGQITLKEQRERDAEKSAFVTEKGAVLIRVPYVLTQEEVYALLVEKLAKVIEPARDIDFSELPTYTTKGVNVRDMCKFYLNHTAMETTARFGLSEQSIRKHFRKLTGVGKSKYLEGEFLTEL